MRSIIDIIIDAYHRHSHFQFKLKIFFRSDRPFCVDKRNMKSTFLNRTLFDEVINYDLLSASDIQHFRPIFNFNSRSTVVGKVELIPQ